MAFYSVILKPALQKDFRRVASVFLPRILQRIEDLQSDPFPRQAIKLSGAERLYRIRVGDYRIVYEVDTGSRQVTVHYVRYRREVYRNL
jgi:mRNA interferase RelE/StbE